METKEDKGSTNKLGYFFKAVKGLNGVFGCLPNDCMKKPKPGSKPAPRINPPISSNHSCDLPKEDDEEYALQLQMKELALFVKMYILAYRNAKKNNANQIFGKALLTAAKK